MDFHINSEETSDLQQKLLETTSSTSVSIEDVQPVVAVDNSPTEVTVTPAKPKYRHLYSTSTSSPLWEFPDVRDKYLIIMGSNLCRHEHYQKPEEVVVTIFAKGVPAKNVSVDFGEQILSVSIDVPGEDSYHLQTRLFGKIIPEKCRYDVLSTKVEIRLAKAEAIQWASLEFSKDSAAHQRVKPSSSVAITERPTYPSSKSKVDWDKLEAEMKKQEKDEKLDGDAALNKFFRDIYQDADEDTRRAMSKSFVESHGTVLSTNWKEVGSKKVEGSPPDGMELKKWEY
ncbi:hypothetical protein G4B88_019498 [Cannabis sativa]|uniref:Protein SGT1 homolog n=1 Tax=Cannabis sativa TaxID=3483 RepID=A0A7J6HZM4_CANSA|nr:hypothetical protein G4B88_019498 [Cannabis sativa]